MVNDSTTDKAVQISFLDPDFSSFGRIPGSGVVRSNGLSIFSFSRKFQTGFYSDYGPIYIPANSGRGFPFRSILTNTYHVKKNTSHSNRCEMTSHGGFDSPGD